VSKGETAVWRWMQCVDVVNQSISGVATYNGALGHVPPRVLEILCILQLLPA